MSYAIQSAVAYWESKAENAIKLAQSAAHLRRLVRHDEGRPSKPRRKPGPKPNVSEGTAEQIRRDRAAGATLPALAVKYRTHYRTLYRILGESA